MLIHALNERSFTSLRSTSIAFSYAKLAQAKNARLRNRAKSGEELASKAERSSCCND